MAQTRLRQFQESFFLVLLTEPRLDKQATLYYSPSYNLDEEQKALEQIFLDLRMSTVSFQDRVNVHFAQAKQADSRYRSVISKTDPNITLDIEDFYILLISP
jgi:hypothetical protein